MAFNIDIPGPRLIDLGLYGKLSDIGSAFQQSREEAAVKEALSGLQSDDPSSYDQAITRLMQTGPTGQAMAIKLRDQQIQAQNRAADLKIREDANRRAAEAHGWSAQDRAQAEANEAAARAEAAGIGTETATVPAKKPTLPSMNTERLDQLVSPEAVPSTGIVPQGVSPVSQSTAPAPRAAPAVDTERLDRLLTPPAPGPGAAMDVPLGGGVDISAASRAPTPVAQPTRLPNPANLNEEQATRMLSLGVGGEGYRKALERQLDKFKKAREEKDKETEATAAVTGKTLGETLKEKGSLRESANKGLYNIEREEQLIRGGTPTGMFSGVRNFVDRMILGAQEQGRETFGPSLEMFRPDLSHVKRRAADYEEIQGLTALSVYDMLGGFGTGITGPERMEMAKAYSNVAKSEGGNLASIKFRRGILEAQKEEGEVFQRYIAQQRQLGQAPRQDEIDYLANKVQEKHIAKLRDQYEADRKKYPAMREAGGGTTKGPISGAPQPQKFLTAPPEAVQELLQNRSPGRVKSFIREFGQDAYDRAIQGGR